MKYLIAVLVLMFLIGDFLFGYFYTPNPENFLLNIISELFGIVLGIIITLFIVDRYIKWSKELEWKRFRKFINDDLAQKIFFILASFQLSFIIQHPVFSYIALDLYLSKGKVSLLTVRKLNDLIQTLRLSGSQANYNSENIKDFFSRTHPQLSSITNNIFPRVLQYSLVFSKDHLLLEKLQTLETIQTNIVSGQIELHNSTSPDPKILSARFNEILSLLHNCELILSEIYQINLSLNPEESPLSGLNLTRIKELNKIHPSLKRYGFEAKEWIKVQIRENNLYRSLLSDIPSFKMFFEQVKFTTSPVSKFNVYLSEKIVAEKLKNIVREMRLVVREIRKRWDAYTSGIDNLCNYSFETDNKELLNYVVSINNTITFIGEERGQSITTIDQIINGLLEWKKIDTPVVDIVNQLVECMENFRNVNEDIVKNADEINQTINKKMNDYVSSIDITL